jgi:hypothetical protein
LIKKFVSGSGKTDASLTHDLLDGDGLEYEGRVYVVLVDGALNEDHPPVVLVCQEVTHFADVSTVFTFFKPLGGGEGVGGALSISLFRVVGMWIGPYRNFGPMPLLTRKEELVR